MYFSTSLICPSTARLMHSAGSRYEIGRQRSTASRRVDGSCFLAAMAGLLLVGMALLSPSVAYAQGVNFIDTVAGGAAPSINALGLDLPGPSAVAEDTNGNIYIAAPASHYVFKVTSSGTASVFAGVGIQGFGGEGGPATSAVLDSPAALAINGAGDIYIADQNRVRCVLAVSGGCGGSSAAVGSIVTVVGTGLVCGPSWGVCGDGGPATSAQLSDPQGLAVDSLGNIYIADTLDQRIRLVSAGVITTIVGTGHICDGPTLGCGDNKPAIGAKLDMPTGVALDASGNVWFTDTRDQRIRCLIEVIGGCNGSTQEVGDVVTTVGTGQYCTDSTKPCGDGLAPTLAHLLNPAGLCFDSAGNLIFADQSINRIRAVTPGPNSIITTIVGNGHAGFSGDGGPPKSATLDLPYAVSIDSKGVLWIADTGNQRIRQVASNKISTFAGGSSNGDGGTASAATLANPLGVTWDLAGNYYIADTAHHRIRKVSSGSATITTVAGTGSAGFSGDGASALSATMQSPGAVAVDAAGNLYIADAGNFIIRKVTAGTGFISTIAGTPGLQCLPSNAPCGDGGSGIGTDAALVNPTSLALDNNNNLYIADYFGHRIRVLSLSTGIINTAAGTGVRGDSVDPGPATSALLNHPWGVATDGSGNLYIADSNNHRVRCVVMVSGGCGGSAQPVGTIVTFAFTGVAGFSGDGNLALKAKMAGPLALASDPANNIYVGGGIDSVVRRIDSDSFTVDTVAGNPLRPTNASFCGDGRPATQACLNNKGLSVNAGLSLLIADAGNNRIRQTNMVGVLTASPTQLIFPDTQVGKNSQPQSVKFQNIGATDVQLGDFSITGPNSGDFKIFGNNCGAKLDPALKCFVSVVFAPTATGPRTAYLKNSLYPQRLLLTGTGQ